MLTVTNSPYGGETVSATAPGARESRPHFVSEAAADKRFLKGTKNANWLVWGKDAWRDPAAGWTWAGTMEFQRSGNPHHHALLYTPELDRLELLEQKRIGRRIVLPELEACFRRAGAGPIIRAEWVQKPEHAAAYITKACRYITKTDGLAYGGPWPNRPGAWLSGV